MRTAIGIAALITLVVLLAVPLLTGWRSDRPGGGAATDQLVVVTPHNEQIRQEFERGFNLWRGEQGLAPVVFDWRTWGGTSELVRGILAAYEAEGRRALAAGEAPGGVGFDVFFGGGAFEHARLARGLAMAVSGGTAAVPIFQAVEFPPGLLAQVFPKPDIGGEPLYDPQCLWVGAALSSFGIVYNGDVLEVLGLPPPKTWGDLVDGEEGRLRGWVILADPAQSGSVATTYETILRRMGWEEGWGLLRRLAANSANFVPYASGVPSAVSAGEAAAGTCIDFYGRYESGAMPAGRVGYVDPPFMTTVSADPVAILHGAPHPELANEFVLWLLSPRAQGLWQRRVGTPGGPHQYELRRLPIRRDLYTPVEMSLWTDNSKPFETSQPVPEGMPSYFGLVSPVMHAMAIDSLGELWGAWSAIIEQGPGAVRRAMLEQFDAMPEDLRVPWADGEVAANWRGILEDATHPRHAEVAAALAEPVRRVTKSWQNDPEARYRDQLRWMQYFRHRYQRVVELGQRQGAKER